MERGSELSKTVATFIVQRILLDENGLSYICNTAERFYAVISVLNNLVGVASGRLVKHLIRCYMRLSENGRVSGILSENLPGCFRDKVFYRSLDELQRKWLQNLFKNLGGNSSGNTTGHTSGHTTGNIIGSSGVRSVPGANKEFR